MHKTIARIFLPLFMIYTIMAPRTTYAILPALVFAELADTAVESFVIRSVAKEVVTTVGTAANDSSWMSTFLQWINVQRAIGSLSFLVPGSISNETVEVQISPDSTADLSHGQTSQTYRQAITMYATASADGQQHGPVTFESADLMTLLGQFVAWWNQYASSGMQIGSFVGCGDSYVNGSGKTFTDCDWFRPASCVN
jgi:hypothetical protein